MASLIRFTNCLLATESGELVKRDLWIDEGSGVILDAQVSLDSLSDKINRD